MPGSSRSRCFPSAGRTASIHPTATGLRDWRRVLELSADFNIAAVNMSFGGGQFSEDCDSDFPAVKATVDNLRAVGIAPVAASGNSSSDSGIHVPACISSVVSVGSTDGIGAGTIREEVSDFSNSSPSLDLLAPGRGIHTSVPGDDFASFNGTSLAVPHVAGAWAVLKSKAPNATVPQLLSMLSRTGIPITDSRNGLIKPRIQVDAALDAVIPEAVLFNRHPPDADRQTRARLPLHALARMR